MMSAWIISSAKPRWGLSFTYGSVVVMKNLFCIVCRNYVWFRRLAVRPLVQELHYDHRRGNGEQHAHKTGQFNPSQKRYQYHNWVDLDRALHHQRNEHIAL